MISAVTRMYDCYGGPSGKSAAYAIYESGSVVCGLIPQVSRQRLENGIMKFATRLTKVGGVDYMDIHMLANETGGEVLSDKLSNFDHFPNAHRSPSQPLQHGFRFEQQET